MAVSGFFTFNDLYAGKGKSYYERIIPPLSTSTPVQTLSISTTTIVSIPTTINPVKLLSSTTIKSLSKLQKFIHLIPFVYFHWFLIVLAVLLSLSLIIIITYYFRTHCKKKTNNNTKILNEKRPSLPSFYRNRTANRRVHAYNIYEPATSLSYASPKRPTTSKSLESLNNHLLLRQGLDAVGSPQVSRNNVSRAGPPSTFTSTASDLLIEIKDRLSTRSSDASFKIEQPYETQRANMALHDESKRGALLIDMN